MALSNRRKSSTMDVRNSPKRSNSMAYENERQMEIGSQLPEDFYYYLDQQDANNDRVLIRFGKRLLSRLRGNGNKLRRNKSNLTILNFESGSSLSVEQPPKKAFSLLGLNSFPKNQLVQHSNLTRNEISSSKDMKDQKLSKLEIPLQHGVSSDGVLEKNSETMVVELRKEDGGFGFNIVGGADNEYIAGDKGIFVSHIRPDTVASRDQRIKEGDRIVSINGISINGKTQNDVLQILHSTDVARMVIEPDAEIRVLNKPTDFSGISTSESVSVRNSESESGQVVSDGSQVSPESKLPPEPTEGVDMLSSRPSKVCDMHINNVFVDPEQRSMTDLIEAEQELSIPSSILTASPFFPLEDEIEMSEQEVLVDNEDVEEDDRASSTSYDTDSVIDDVPRTPKKPYRLFDPSSTSVVNEIIFVSAGVAALGVGIYLGYRFLKHRSLI